MVLPDIGGGGTQMQFSSSWDDARTVLPLALVRCACLNPYKETLGENG